MPTGYRSVTCLVVIARVAQVILTANEEVVVIDLFESEAATELKRPLNRLLEVLPVPVLAQGLCQTGSPESKLEEPFDGKPSIAEPLP